MRFLRARRPCGVVLATSTIAAAIAILVIVSGTAATTKGSEKCFASLSGENSVLSVRTRLASTTATSATLFRFTRE